jgi:hypothetical protein
MKLSKILITINNILDDDRRAQVQEIDSLKVSIKRLKKKQKEFEEQCQKAKDVEEREKLHKKISIARAQRKKGLKLLRELKQELEK